MEPSLLVNHPGLVEAGYSNHGLLSCPRLTVVKRCQVLLVDETSICSRHCYVMTVIVNLTPHSIWTHYRVPMTPAVFLALTNTIPLYWFHGC